MTKKKKSPRSKTVVMVVWDDAHGTLESASDADLKNIKPCRTRSVGWLVAENQHGVVIAMDRWDEKPFDKDSGNYAFIPHGMIIEKVELCGS
jgi:hypothetical protein